MKTKNISLMIASILTVVLLLGLTSAVSLDPITESTIPADVAHDAGTFEITFNLTNTGAEGTLDYSASAVTTGTGSIAFDDSTIAAGPATETITATVRTIPKT